MPESIRSNHVSRGNRENQGQQAEYAFHKCKSQLARALRRNHTARIEAQDPKYKGLVKQSVKKPSSIDPKRYEELVSQMMLAQEDENDDDFEVEEENQ
jgi:hypothetical protein